MRAQGQFYLIRALPRDEAYTVNIALELVTQSVCSMLASYLQRRYRAGIAEDYLEVLKKEKILILPISLELVHWSYKIELEQGARIERDI